MKTVKILRDLFYDGQASLGTCYVFDEDCNRIFKSASLERGWVNNENMISCLPIGKYRLVYEWSPHFETMLWEIYGTGHRRECKFHVANYWYQLNGCIGLGRSEKYIDGDNVLDVTYSVDTMAKFHEALEGETEAILIIENYVL